MSNICACGHPFLAHLTQRVDGDYETECIYCGCDRFEERKNGRPMTAQERIAAAAMNRGEFDGEPDEVINREIIAARSGIELARSGARRPGLIAALRHLFGAAAMISQADGDAFDVVAEAVKEDR